MPKHLPRFSSGHTDSHWRGGATVTELPRPPRASPASHHRVSAIAPSSVSLARASVAARTSKRRPRTKARRASHPRASPSHQRASRLAPASIGLRTRERRPRPRASANPYGAPENRLDPRPSAPPPTKAAVPKHLPRFSSGHTDSHCRVTPVAEHPPPASSPRTNDPQASHQRPPIPTITPPRSARRTRRQTTWASRLRHN